MGISGSTIHGLVVAAALLLGSLAVLARVEPSSGDRSVARVIRFALLLKLAAAPAHLYIANRVYENVADANLYHTAGAALAEQFRRGDFHVELPHRILGLGVVYIVTGLVYALIGVSKTGGALVFSAFSFWGLYLFFRAARLALPELDTTRYAKLLFLLPSMLFWSSTIGKDALMCFALGVSALGAARVLTRRPLGFAVLAIGTVGTAIIRPHVTLMFFVGLSVAYMVRPSSGRSPTEPALKLVGIAVLVVGGAFLAQHVERFLRIPDLRPETVDETLGETAFRTGSESPFGVEGDGYDSSFDTTGLRSPLALPGAVVTVLFRPFPFEAHNGPSRLAALEGAFLVLLLLLSTRRLRCALSMWRQRPYVTLATVYVLVFCYLFAAIGNFGILARQRVQVLPLLLVLLALPDARRAMSRRSPQRVQRQRPR